MLPGWSCAAEPQHGELAEHRVDRVEFLKIKFNWPRPVGKNARKGVHGQFKEARVVRLLTDQGASGWGIANGNKEAAAAIEDKAVGELIDPGVGLAKGVPKVFDFALHDLAGVILGQPVYKLLGGEGPTAIPIYSGMIYFDELEPPANPAGFDRVIENCQWDVDYGYRQLKVKIGRSGRWYEHDEGLQADIDIVRRIHQIFGDQGVEILVDANDMYSTQDAIDFLRGLEGVPLYWFEEPFVEDRQESKQLRDWMDTNGFEKTYLADGEFKPDTELVLELARSGVLDVCLHDIDSYGFTRWRRLMPILEELGALASPHAWGSQFKTYYCGHIAAGLGNCCTIEGVTCETDDVDFGEYRIEDGKLQVSQEPGFGMKLLV